MCGFGILFLAHNKSHICSLLLFGASRWGAVRSEMLVCSPRCKERGCMTCRSFYFDLSYQRGVCACKLLLTGCLLLVYYAFDVFFLSVVLSILYSAKCILFIQGDIYYSVSSEMRLKFFCLFLFHITFLINFLITASEASVVMRDWQTISIFRGKKQNPKSSHDCPSKQIRSQFERGIVLQQY